MGKKVKSNAERLVMTDAILKGWYDNLKHSRDVLGLDVAGAKYSVKSGGIKFTATAEELIEIYEGIDA